VASSNSVFQVVGLLAPKQPCWTGFERCRRPVRDNRPYRWLREKIVDYNSLLAEPTLNEACEDYFETNYGFTVVL